MNERIKWIDIVKFFGIFGIYMGHYGELAGKSYAFALTHLIALFFFASGCMENYSRETHFGKYVIKKIKTIMIPFWLFGALATVVTLIYGNYDFQYVKGAIKEVGLGVIRNTFPAASLWFLTCLFVMQLMFFFVRKVRIKILMVVLGVVMYLIAVYVITPSPMWYPTWPYNVDSALYYMIYYIIGYCVFPYVMKLFVLDTKGKKIGVGISGILASVYAICSYFGIDPFSYMNLPSEVIIFLPIISSCIVTWALFVCARLVEDIDVLSNLGKNSLYLCGCEYIVKTLATCFFGIVGFNLVLPNPLSVYIYAAILLLFANKYIVPIEKYILKKIVKA